MKIIKKLRTIEPKRREKNENPKTLLKNIPIRYCETKGIATQSEN
jgi:hypothetical protein